MPTDSIEIVEIELCKILLSFIISLVASFPIQIRESSCSNACITIRPAIGCLIVIIEEICFIIKLIGEHQIIFF